MRLFAVRAALLIAGWSLAGNCFADPPPPSREMQASMNAMNSLFYAVGDWTGEAAATRRVSHGPGDIIYFDAGGQRQGIKFVDVIVFDVNTGQLRIFLPGYRSIDGGGSSAQLVPLFHSGEIMFRWEENAFPCDHAVGHLHAMKRTTVRVVGDDWLEEQECIDENGSSFYPSSFSLKRSSASPR